MQQPVNLNVSRFSVGAVVVIDAVVFVLIEAEIAQYEIGHGLVQITEKDHLQYLVNVLPGDADERFCFMQLCKKIGIVLVD